jgi:hypothetical protein
MSDRRFAADGIAYTYTDFVKWYGPQAKKMWGGAAATEHSQNYSPDCGSSAMSLPDRRIAADGTAYTYNDFVDWYGQDANKLWEEAAATEHSQNYFTAINASPELELHAATTRRCATEADFVQMQDMEPLSTEHGRNATEHSALNTDTETSASGSNDAHTIAPEYLLQCSQCQRPLCSTEDLAFFWRKNKQGGVEVHLMLKPEREPPATFVRSPVTDRGAIVSWRCFGCGFKFGDTRNIAVKKAAMTAFKSSSVMLCGQRFTGSKSKWPSIYDTAPFNTIEVRTSDTFFASQPAFDFQLLASAEHLTLQ